MRLCKSASIFVLTAALASRASAANYSITDLGHEVNGVQISDVNGINSSGQVAGSTFNIFLGFSGGTPYDYPVNRGFFYDGAVHEFGAADDRNFAVGITNQGEVIGQSLSSGRLPTYPFIFTSGGGFQNLNALLPAGSSWTLNGASSVSRTGKVVGSGTMNGESRYYSFDLGTHQIQDLGEIWPSYTIVAGNNSNGKLAGYLTTLDGQANHAFFYDGTMHDLGTLGGQHSYATAINSQGTVVGYSQVAGSDFDSEPFLYDGTLHDLGTLPGRNYSLALGINDHGDVVGRASLYLSPLPDGEPYDKAFLYTSAGGVVDLNSLIEPSSGWVLNSAQVINDAGQIAGMGTYQGETHAFLLSPVPEPSGVFLMASAALGLFMARKWAFPRGRDGL